MAKYAIVRFLDDESPLLLQMIGIYLEHCRTYKSPRTITAMDRPALKSFSNFIGDVRLSEIAQDKCMSWMACEKRRLKLNSLNTIVSAVRAFLNYCVRTGRLSINPLSRVKLPPPTFAGRLLSDDEIHKFLSRIERQDIRNACLVSLYAGLRSQEIAALDSSWIVGDFIVIPPEKSKSRRGRMIMIHPEIADILSKDGSIFGFTAKTLRYHVAKAWRAAGLGRIRFHDMRHNWATRFLEMVKDPKPVMDAGGWATEASMRPYQHMTRARQKQILGIHYGLHPRSNAGG